MVRRKKSSGSSATSKFKSPSTSLDGLPSSFCSTTAAIFSRKSSFFSNSYRGPEPSTSVSAASSSSELALLEGKSSPTKWGPSVDILSASLCRSWRASPASAELSLLDDNKSGCLSSCLSASRLASAWPRLRLSCSRAIRTLSPRCRVSHFMIFIGGIPLRSTICCRDRKDSQGSKNVSTETCHGKKRINKDPSSPGWAIIFALSDWNSWIWCSPSGWVERIIFINDTLVDKPTRQAPLSGLVAWILLAFDVKIVRSPVTF